MITQKDIDTYWEQTHSWAAVATKFCEGSKCPMCGNYIGDYVLYCGFQSCLWGQSCYSRLSPSLDDLKLSKGVPMSDITTDIKRLELSEEDRLMQDHGFVDELGVITDLGASVIWPHILKDYKAKVVADLKAVKANQAKEVKAKVDDTLSALKGLTK